MLTRTLADIVLVVHVAFIVFVVLGGLLVWRNRGWALAHVPSVCWVAFVEYTRDICPLTAMEKMLRARAGMEGYEGDFIAHYLLPIIHPPGLTSRVQISLSLIVVSLNLVLYARLCGSQQWISWRTATPRNRGHARVGTREDPR